MTLSPDVPLARFAELAFLHFHETYHLGQIGLLRRILGKPGFV